MVIRQRNKAADVRTVSWTPQASGIPTHSQLNTRGNVRPESGVAARLDSAGSGIGLFASPCAVSGAVGPAPWCERRTGRTSRFDTKPARSRPAMMYMVAVYASALG